MLKLLRQNNSQSDETSIHIVHNLHKLPSCVFFADNFRECATFNAFHEEILKIHFILNQGRSIFLKETRLEGKMRHFVLLFSLTCENSRPCSLPAGAKKDGCFRYI